MLVYHDASETIAPRLVLSTLRSRVARLAAQPLGIEAHAALVRLLIDSAELGQGLIDAEFERLSVDTVSPLRAATMRLLTGLAVAIDRSWQHEFRVPDLYALHRLFQALADLRLPEQVRCKQPEGFAFYAVYPESYLCAARALPMGTDVRVIGIRSIGTALAALVGAGTAAHVIETLRPIGPPFDRRLSLAPELAQAIMAGSPERFAIADEGPGLSGSSFGSVADFLEARGVEPGRIHFFPSHSGEPGPRATEARRARWRAAPRHIVDFDALALRPHRPWQHLRSWVEDLLAGEVGQLEDISAGHWRLRRYAAEADWPPANVQQERRKFLLQRREERDTLLLKFAGLDRRAEGKLARARALDEAGLGPPIVGFRHGFLVQQWLGESRPLHLAVVDKEHLIVELSRYLGFRAHHFVGGSGATPAQLGEMLRHNAEEALGRETAAACARIYAELRRLEDRIEPVATDNRLHVWEWLQTADGRLLKSDAIDHCETHDLIGCQDIAWDIAGASVELALSAEERNALRERIQHISGRQVSRHLLDCLLPCYLAFQLGVCKMAADALVELPAESRRLAARAELYATQLRHNTSA